MKKSILRLLGGAFISALIVGCSSDDSTSSPAKEKSIVILYENDVHCAITGYPKMRGLADAILASDTSYVGLVSSGDFLQGALSGAYSHGQYIVDIMKNMGYDAITLGNHEFDYGVPRMLELLPQIGAPVVSANFTEVGKTETIFPPYVIKQYGDKRIAFVGVLTPETMLAEAYAFFDEDNNLLYDLNALEVYDMVQEAVDDARAEGADYVIVLSHLGESNETGVDSHSMVNATRGIDAVLDGHTHAVIPGEWVGNIDGQPVPVTQTGTQFANYGKLWISRDGKFHTSLVADDDNPYCNTNVAATVDSIQTLLDAATSETVGTSDFDLLVKNPSGDWIVRSEEASIGDLVSDAFRIISDTQIGLINGGALRNDILAGEIIYGHVMSLLPNDNHVSIIVATGKDILDMLEECCINCPDDDGSFPQVSGMKFTIHTVSNTVSDVMVYNEETDAFEPIDENKSYTIAVNDYYRTGGFYGLLAECRLIKDTAICRDVVRQYIIEILDGVISDIYKEAQDRIRIVYD